MRSKVSVAVGHLGLELAPYHDLKAEPGLYSDVMLLASRQQCLKVYCEVLGRLTRRALLVTVVRLVYQ